VRMTEFHVFAVLLAARDSSISSSIATLWFMKRLVPLGDHVAEFGPAQHPALQETMTAQTFLY